MYRDIDVKLTPISSPICQALIHESTQDQLDDAKKSMLERCSELLVIRLNSTVIGYASFEEVDQDEAALKSIYFRGIIKDHDLGEYWISRLLKRYLDNKGSEALLLAS